MCEGIGAELAGIDLGDKRLNQRSVRVLETLAANPQASVNAACDGWSDTLAAKACARLLSCQTGGLAITVIRGQANRNRASGCPTKAWR